MCALVAIHPPCGTPVFHALIRSGADSLLIRLLSFHQQRGPTGQVFQYGETPASGPPGFEISLLVEDFLRLFQQIARFMTLEDHQQ